MASTPRPRPTARSTSADAPPRTSLGAIFRVFATISSTSFGGGQKAQIRRACVARGWLTDERFVEALELSQVLPGANIVNLAVYVGESQRGTLGALVAFAACTIPPFAIVLAAGWWYLSPYDTAFAHRMLTGCAVGAVGLSLGNAVDLTLDQRSEWTSLVIITLVAVLVGQFRLPLLPALAVFGGLGILLFAQGKRRGAT